MTCWLFLLIGSSDNFSADDDVITFMWHAFHEKLFQSRKLLKYFSNAYSVCQIEKACNLNVAN